MLDEEFCEIIHEFFPEANPWGCLVMDGRDKEERGGEGGLDVRRGNCFSSVIPAEFIAARVKRRYRGPIDGAP